MFVGVVRWPRVGPWRWRIVLRPVPRLSSASTSDHRKATFLLGRRICFLGGKCSTVSLACPHAHWSVSATLIRYRYPLSLAMPVRS
ncbi:unnamed protein product [Penicillium salamii]|nr:unnamed protein product [Penicillium salamii]CAG8315797.1 unnamed protein product [Penicillium salamii]CAG8371559.1 unnamed protein product [Penicillium salamii]